MRLEWLLKQIAIISQYSINPSFRIMESVGIYCEAEAQIYRTDHTNFVPKTFNLRK
jgi:hypothetical protein